MGCGALEQVIKRTAPLFLRKIVIPAGKRVDSELLDYAVLELDDIVSGREDFKTAAKSVGRKTLTK